MCYFSILDETIADLGTEISFWKRLIYEKYFHNNNAIILHMNNYAFEQQMGRMW